MHEEAPGPQTRTETCLHPQISLPPPLHRGPCVLLATRHLLGAPQEHGVHVRAARQLPSPFLTPAPCSPSYKEQGQAEAAGSLIPGAGLSPVVHKEHVSSPKSLEIASESRKEQAGLVGECSRGRHNFPTILLKVFKLSDKCQVIRSVSIEVVLNVLRKKLSVSSPSELLKTWLQL